MKLALAQRAADVAALCSPRNWGLGSELRREIVTAERSTKKVVADYRAAVEAHVWAERNRPLMLNSGRERERALDEAKSSKALTEGLIAAISTAGLSYSVSIPVNIRRCVARRLVDAASAAAFTAISYRNDLSAPLRVFDERMAAAREELKNLDKGESPLRGLIDEKLFKVAPVEICEPEDLAVSPDLKLHLHADLHDPVGRDTEKVGR